MTNWQNELDAIDAEIIAAEAGRAGLAAMLAETEEEYESFRLASEVNVATLPLDLVRPTVESATLFAVQGPTLRRTVKEVSRRLEKANENLSNLRQRRSSIAAQLTAQRAAAMLVQSKELGKVETLLGDVLALWAYGANTTEIGQVTRAAQQAVTQLVRVAKAATAGGQ